ncbi:hypothetical protein [Mesorhizobium sp. LNHC221B00]|uniref:hypothetical protein n=1 Tax=Mesorhizobium sp. LNHC221B00 TaxID=1287233 RepID=UPI0012EB9105|nr:hypothetical protein [Mesorhizobium sp. LNHC221B00]
MATLPESRLPKYSSYPAVKPPSIGTATPVMCLACSLARRNAGLAAIRSLLRRGDQDEIQRHQKGRENDRRRSGLPKADDDPEGRRNSFTTAHYPSGETILRYHFHPVTDKQLLLPSAIRRGDASDTELADFAPQLGRWRAFRFHSI